jgi:diaminohydroxyphosphoribosylaminopyrimidine deaminase/5-amino-6-(5-phosphoribosylamino)uracil reductase
MGVLVEGGGGVAARALREGVVDRVILFVAPKLVGGDGLPAIDGLGVRRMADAMPLEILSVERVGEDLRIDARPGFRRTDRRARIHVAGGSRR